MSEKESAIISNGSRKYVTIKIDTDVLVDVFNDMHYPNFKVKNKLGFASSFSESLAEYLRQEGLDLVMDTMADNDETWMKYCEEEE